MTTKISKIFTLALVSILMLFCGSGFQPKSLDKNHPLFNIELNTLNREAFSLAKVKAKGIVIVVMSPECPLSRSYTLTINKLAEKYHRKGIRFYAIFPGSEMAVMDVVKFQRKYKLEPEVLLDPQFKMVDMLRASVTPEAFLIDPSGEVRYQGAIDNWVYSLTKKRQVITQHYLDEALNSLVTGFPMDVEKTQPIGCFINMPAYGN